VAGHSLGGALATIASMDLMHHTVPKINEHLKSQQRFPRSESSEFQRHGRANVVREVNLSTYVFGSPRVGNKRFANKYNRIVPNTFRISNDGDIVTGVPPSWKYKHIGHNIVVDRKGSGKVLINPSFIENRFSRRSKTSVQAHIPSNYERSILGIFHAEESSSEMISRIIQKYKRPLPNTESDIEEGESEGEEEFKISFVSRRSASTADRQDSDTMEEKR